MSSASDQRLRILVAGGDGQLATELRRAASAHAVEFFAPGRVFDITDEIAVENTIEALRPELVINAAAYTAVDRAESEQELAFRTNELGPRNLARACARFSAALLHVSSDYVFNGQKQLPYVESDAVDPLSVYGRSKLAGELRVREELPAHVILRASWVFSATGVNFVKTMLRLARERDVLRVVSDQRGRPTAAHDLAQALFALSDTFARTKSLPWGTYHFAGAGAVSWYEFAVEIVRQSAAFGGKQPKVEAIGTAQYPTPAVRPMNSVLDTEHFEQTFGIQPRAWQVGLSDVMAELHAAQESKS
jgi:dTDP-4-dehydrorhamnose reductase